MIKELWAKLSGKSEEIQANENVINFGSAKQKKAILSGLSSDHPQKLTDILGPARELAKVETQPIMLVGFGCHSCGLSVLAMAPMDLGLAMKACMRCNYLSVTAYAVFGILSGTQEILCPDFHETDFCMTFGEE